MGVTEREEKDVFIPGHTVVVQFCPVQNTGADSHGLLSFKY